MKSAPAKQKQIVTVPMEFTICTAAPAGSQQSAVAETILNALFAAEQAHPIDDIDYDAFKAQALIVGQRAQWCQPLGRSLRDVFRALRFASDSGGDFAPGSLLARARAAMASDAPVQCNPGYPNDRIIFVVTNISDRPQPFSIRLTGRGLEAAHKPTKENTCRVNQT